MKNKYKVIIVLAVLGLIIVLGGATYAYFTANTSGNETGSTLTVQGGILEITYANQSSIITLDNIYPRETEWVTKNFTVTGTNTIDTTMNYRVGIEALSSGFADGDLTYTLTNTDVVTPTGNPIESASGEILASGTTWIDYGQFAASSNGVVHTYQLKIYYLSTNESQNNKQGESFKGKVVLVEAEIGELLEPEVVDNTPAPTGWKTAQSPTLLNAIKSKYTVSEPLTTPGQDISLANEAVLASTPDDYGTSYYFRGNVQDNYVLFAGKCWRIVRIDGNGNIKLLLWKNSATCTGTLTPVSDISNFNPSSAKDELNVTAGNKATGVGFIYGHANPTGGTDYEKYLDAQANITDSFVLGDIKTWYDSTFNTTVKLNKLADVIWCVDKSISTGLGYGQTETYFGAYERLVINKTPSLICPTTTTYDGDTHDVGTLFKYTANDTENGNGALNGYKIGLLTADEVAFAGGVYGVSNSNYYLNNNKAYWTLTPYSFEIWNNQYYPNVFDVFSGMLNNYTVNQRRNLYPVISLIPTVTLANTSGQNGTAAYPYNISPY